MKFAGQSETFMEARRQFDQGFWSTNSEHHAIIHDLGHAVHYKRDSANYDRLSGEAMPSAARSELAGKVSRYAMESPLEFVAEVFAGLFDGKVYDAEVIKWYKQFKGPRRTRQGS